MAQFYCTGPAHLWVAGYSLGGGSLGTPLYLGTAKNAPHMSHDPAFIPVMNDIGGQVKCFELMYEGEEAFIVAELSRYKESTYRLLAARHTNINNAGTRGFEPAGAIGALMTTENIAPCLWVRFPYSASKTAFANATNGAMPAGYRFVRANFVGPDQHQIGTQPKHVTVAFHATRQYDSTGGTFTLFDHDVSALGQED